MKNSYLVVVAENDTLRAMYLHSSGGEILDVAVVITPSHIYSRNLRQENLEKGGELSLLLEASDRNIMFYVSSYYKSVGFMLFDECEKF